MTAAFFAHDDLWQSWEEAVNWIGAHTPPEAIVATSAPRFMLPLNE